MYSIQKIDANPITFGKSGKSVCKRIVNGCILGKSQNLGSGIKRMLKYASIGSGERPQLVHIGTVGEGADAVQIREYANGVTFYENRDGMIIMGSNNVELGKFKDKLFHLYPVAATFRKVSKTGGKIQKFIEFLTEVTQKYKIRDYITNKVYKKTENIKCSNENRNVAEELHDNWDRMIKTFIRNAE